MDPSYPTSQLMADVMATIEVNMPPIVTVALYLAAINFAFGMLYFALTYLARKPFKG